MATTGKIERTNIPGAVPNVTDPANTSYIEPGALFINVTDQLLYSSNGTNYFLVGGAGGGGSANVSILSDTFTGDNTSTVFTLSSASATDRTFVFLNGVAQVPVTDFTVSGTTLTFTAPPASTDTISVRYIDTVSIYTVGLTAYFSPGDVQYTSDFFTGNGSNVEFTLGTSLAGNTYALVYLNGVSQVPTTDYGVDGTTLTFQTAPANLDSIQVVGIEPVVDIVTTTFTGNGSNKTFTLPYPSTTNKTFVYLNGIAQAPVTQYFVDGKTLSFITAPASIDTITVRSLFYRQDASGANTTVQFNDGGNISGSNGFVFDKTSNNVTVGNTLIAPNIRISASNPPATPTATGSAGTVTWDNGYLYVAVATNQWKKVPISTSGIVGTGGGGAGVGITRESFSANGTATVFTLSTEPIDEEHLMVYVDRVLQRDPDYTVSGYTLTFATAPPNGADVDAYIMSSAEQDVKGVMRNTFVGNGTNTQFTLGASSSDGVYALVYVDTVFQPHTEYAVSGTTITFNTAPINGASIDVVQLGVGLVGDPQAAGSNNEIQYHYSNSFAANNKFTFNPSTTTLALGSNLTINTSTIFIGNSTVNTTIIAGNVDLQGTQLRVGNVVINGNQLTLGNPVGLTVTDSQITIGNSTVNTVLGSTGTINTTSLDVTKTAGNATHNITTYGSGVSNFLNFRRARGTQAAPTSADGGAFLGTLQWSGWDGTQFVGSSIIRSIQDGSAVSTGIVRSYIDLMTANTTGGLESRIIVAANGNVSIGGSLSPSNRLEVEGATFNRFTMKATTNVQNGLQIIRTGASFATDWELYTPQGNTDLRLYTSSDRVTFASNGSVGIGTTSPTYKLHVVGGVTADGSAGEAQVNVLNTTNRSYIFNSTSAFGFYDSTNARYYAYYDRTSNFWDFRIAGTTAALISSSRHVGIGTASPTHRLDIWGNDGSNTPMFRIATKQSGTADYQTIATIGPTGTSVNDGWFQLYDNAVAKVNIAANASRGGHTYFNTGGNVGIGTTSPSVALHVVGSAYASSDLYVGSDAVRISTDGSGELGIGYGQTATNQRFTVYNNTTAAFVVKPNGNVGIGTTSPYNARLHVAGNTTSPDLSSAVVSNASAVLGNSDREYGMHFATYGSGSGAIQQRRGGTAVYYDLYLQPHGGNVGIGTTNPGYKLDVTGAIRSTNEVYSTRNAVNTGFISLTSGSGSNMLPLLNAVSENNGLAGFYFIVNKSANQSAVTGYTAGAFRFTTDFNQTSGLLFAVDNNYSNRFAIDYNGNVGIGTTSPLRPLQVNGIEISISSVGSQAGYTQGAFLSSSGTDSTPSARGQGMFLFNEDNDVTWYLGTNYTSSDVFSINRKASTTSVDTSTAQLTHSLFSILSGGAIGVNFSGLNAAGYGQFAINWNPTNTTNNNGVGLAIRTSTATTDATFALFFNEGGTGIGSIKRTGTTNAVSFNTTSDRRLKENILPADSPSAIIDNIEIVKHDWKDGGHVRYGAVAQDLINIAPEAVSVGDPEEVENPRNPWGVDYSKLVPMLIKEIQELRARVAALESN